MKKSMMMVVICGWCSLTGYSATNYVNRATGDDGYNGTTPATAKRTIQAAVNIANAGDTVLVAPGIYDEGTTVTPGSLGWLQNRVVITKNITLESTHGEHETIILGARDPVDITFDGCGSNAVRCVYMTTGTLKGFTLTGGASGSVNKEDANNRGGGLYASTVGALPVVYDCVISNNAARRGGGVFAGNLHRCLVAGNSADKNGGGVRDSMMHDSLIVHNSGGGASHCYSNDSGRSSGIFNCTVAHNSGRGLDQCSGFNTIVVGNTSAFNASYDEITFVNCCLSAATELGTNNIVAIDLDFVDAANGDFRMLESSPCFDAGDLTFNGRAMGADQRTDYLGNPRLQGTGVDIGAIEGSAANTATVACVAPTGSGSLSPIGHFVLTTLPTQLLFTATADAGWALRHFMINGAKMMDCGNTFTMTVTQPKAHIISAVFLPARYVDAESGSDANDGTAPESAWRTLQHAVDTASVGSMVVAAPGFYAEGGKVAYEHSNRVSISRNVILKGSGVGKSFIMGAADLGPGSDAYGCGSNAVRCVTMTTGELEGFTITGGRAFNQVGDAWRVRGGGLVVYPYKTSQIWDCVISNNVATRGAAFFGGVYHRCRIEENRATLSGVNHYGTCYDCLFVHNNGWVTSEGPKLYNCTVTANEKGIRSLSVTVAAKIFNTISYGNISHDVQAGLFTAATNCCTGATLFPGEGNIAADPLFVDAPKGDYRLRADSPCRDTGNAAYSYDPDHGTDLLGTPRSIGAQVNMGAFESCVGVINVVSPASGMITPSGTLLFESLPTNVTFTVTEQPGRTLVYFSTNGVPVPYAGNSITLAVSTPETGIQLEAHFEGSFYADPTRPDDLGDGGSWATAKRTLQAAVDLALDNETVWAAPGVYNEGTRLTPIEFSSNGYLKNRLLITNDITVCSRDGAATTVILGALDSASGDAKGRGPNAVRGVYMSKGRLEGFTITGGATGNEDIEDENNRGGGVYVNYNNLVPLVLDCVISNNAAHRGGGTYFGTLKRCLIRDNYAQVNGAGIRNGIVHDCLITENSGASTVAYATLYHCTVAGNFDRGLSDDVLAYNSISSGNALGDLLGRIVCTNCCLTALVPGEGNIVADPLFVDSAKGDYRLAAGSPCIDSANPTYTEDFFGVTLDGAQRTQNGVPDIGAYEWDWRPVFADDLDGFGLTVTEVTPFVTHVTDASYMGGSAVYLDGAAARANGQEGVELALSWNLRSTNTGYISFEVDGTGTLTLYEGEQQIASAVAADGAQRVKHTVQQKPASLRVVYTAPEGDTGGALLDAFEGVGGLLLILR